MTKPLKIVFILAAPPLPHIVKTVIGTSVEFLHTHRGNFARENFCKYLCLDSTPTGGVKSTCLPL